MEVEVVVVVGHMHKGQVVVHTYKVEVGVGRNKPELESNHKAISFHLKQTIWYFC